MSRHRRTVTGLLLCGLVLGLSCSGPSASREGAGAGDRPSRVYHVQLDMTDSKAAADRALSRALAWWGETEDASLPAPIDAPGEAGRSPVSVVWQAPLYRVRLGPYASRSAAEAALSAARPAFPEAFVAPERRAPAD